MRTTRLLAGTLLAATASLAWLAPASAQAASPSVTVAPSTGVTPGSMVTVTGSGFAPGGGVYVMGCAKPTGALGTADGRAKSCNPDQANDHTVWKTPIAADGKFSVQLKVESSFGTTDCTKVSCGVFVRKDHMGGATDYSQDAYTPIAFAAAAQGTTTTAAPTTTVATSAPAATAGTGAEAAPSTEVAGEQLATTGTNLDLALVGGGVLLAGAALVAVSRRRSQV